MFFKIKKNKILKKILKLDFSLPLKLLNNLAEENACKYN